MTSHHASKPGKHCDAIPLKLGYYCGKRVENHKVNYNFLDDIDKVALEYLMKGEEPDISHLNNDAVKIDVFCKILRPNAQRAKYVRRYNEFKRALHWGQLKLMLSEIEFLTIVRDLHRDLGDTRPIYLVYAGAAPGHHAVYLSALFPDVHFELYDPNDFAPDIVETDRFKTYVQFFTDTDAHYWREQTADKFVVFCSDIRTEPATEDNVAFDMELQYGWWKIINPELSIFKFRLRWTEGKTEYPDGDIYIQAYSGPTSSEHRIIIKKDAPIIKYDHIKYEEQCMYHNNVTRKQYFRTDLGHLTIAEHSIDNCYDCTRFVNIIKDYFGTNYTNDKLLAFISGLQNRIMYTNTIYSVTKREQDMYLSGLLQRCYVQCSDVKCPICFHDFRQNDGSYRRWAGKSNATRENFDKVK